MVLLREKVDVIESYLLTLAVISLRYVALLVLYDDKSITILKHLSFHTATSHDSNINNNSWLMR